jgi:putative salt-induced outer membrane protein YdiY
LSWFQAAVGAEVVLVNGDRLSGRILQADQDTVVLETDYVGTLTIERNKVQSLRRDPVQAGTEVSAHSDAGPGAVADGSNPNQPQGSAQPPADDSAGPTVTTSARSSPFTPGNNLTGRVDFALSDDKGNTDKNEIDVDYQVEYRRGWNRLTSLGALEFDTNDGEKTTDKWSTYNQYSRLFPSRWYGAAWFALKHDRFADLRLRTLGGPAIGYLAVESEAMNLSIEAGPAALQDDFYDHVDQDSLGMAWSLHYDQLLWQGSLQPYHRQFGYVALDDKDKFLWQSWTGLRVPLASGFTGAVEFEYDYDSNPAVATKTTDTTLRLKLGYQW